MTMHIRPAFDGHAKRADRYRLCADEIRAIAQHVKQERTWERLKMMALECDLMADALEACVPESGATQAHPSLLATEH
jgi:hypothetical protein